MLPLWHGGFHDDGQPHDELGPPPNPLAASIDPAVVHLDQPPHKRQPDPQPALCLLQRPIHLTEHVEDVGQLVGRDADAGVLDRHHHVAPLPLGGQPDLAPTVVVLGGVVQQVGEHLSEPGRVGVHDDRVLGQPDGQFVAHLLDQRAARLHGTAHHRRQLHPLLL
jgi:hypothetical protein